MQEKKALSSRGRGHLRGFLELRRPWGFSPDPRPGTLFEGYPVGEGTTRRGTATPVHRPQRPEGSTHSSTRGLSDCIFSLKSFLCNFKPSCLRNLKRNHQTPDFVFKSFNSLETALESVCPTHLARRTWTGPPTCRMANTRLRPVIRRSVGRGQTDRLTADTGKAQVGSHPGEFPLESPNWGLPGWRGG